MDTTLGHDRSADGTSDPGTTSSGDVPAPRPPAARLACCGDLDLLTADAVLRDVEALLALGYRDVHVDLGRLRFCDAAGLDGLLAAKKRVRLAGGTLTLSPHGCQSLALLLRVFRLTGDLDPAGRPSAGDVAPDRS